MTPGFTLTPPFKQDIGIFQCNWCQEYVDCKMRDVCIRECGSSLQVGLNRRPGRGGYLQASS